MRRKTQFNDNQVGGKSAAGETAELTVLRSWDRSLLCGRPDLPNTGLCSVCPPSVPEESGFLQVADLSGAGRFLGGLGLLGNTGLWGRQDADVTEEVKLSWEDKVIPELQSLTWGLQGLRDFLCWVLLPNTGLLQYSGLSSFSPLSPWSISEKTGLLRNVRSLELLGNIGLLGWADKVQLSWEHETDPEVLQVSSTSLLSRGTRTSALPLIEGKTGDLRSWQSSIWVESELWCGVERRQTWSMHVG